jgi:adenosine deaminase
MKFTPEIIQKLPKAELHCHLDGSLRTSTILELAKEQNIKLPSHNESELDSYLKIGPNVGSLVEYLERFDITLSVLQTSNALTRVAYELAIDCWDDGVRYVEVRYSPILHTQQGMTMSEAVEAVKIGLEKAENDCGILTGIIICGIRNISPEISLKLADLTVQYKNKGVVGFDLAGAEENFPAKHHKEAFDLILRNNINTTIHAGEAYGPDSIHQAIHSCGAHRIGHGTRLQEDKDLLQYVNDHRIPLEICLTSNVQTKSVPSMEVHPFKSYLNKRLRVTLNTDNRLISDTNLSQEYRIAIEEFNLNKHEVRTLIINGFKSAFIPHEKRRNLIRKIVDDLEQNFDFDRRVII